MTPAIAALALAGCGSIIPTGNSGGIGGGSAASSPSGTSQTYTRTAPPRMASAPQSVAPRAEDAACLTNLSNAGARFNPLPDTYAAPGCNKLGTVQLSALAGDTSQFGISNIGAVQCRVASAFGDWARFGVDRAARQLLGSPLARIETMGSYSCRNVAGSQRRSAHASAEAIDVSAFVLEDGRRISLTEDWDGGTAAEREFLRVVHSSACKRFGTVLGPDYNRAHADHFHLEGTGSSFCR
ncbi:extensin family protein [Qipengyuania sp. ASV99]|uniref:extensin-like domain-containing protein n=1 Tax=Qipengyuania sp. ASV99 TaxID=3399681 RepID=UPI003A4C566D